jgi:hypothetical protein
MTFSFLASAPLLQPQSYKVQMIYMFLMIHEGTDLVKGIKAKTTIFETKEQYL